MEEKFNEFKKFTGSEKSLKHKFKDPPLSGLYLAGPVKTFWTLAQEVEGSSNPFYKNVVTEFRENSIMVPRYVFRKM